MDNKTCSLNIAFFVKTFTGDSIDTGGTDSTIFNYAKYNEEILHNRSYIICLHKDTLMEELGIEDDRKTFLKFNARFKIIELRNISAISEIIERFKLDIFYHLDSGIGHEYLSFDQKDLWQNCKTMHQCIYDTSDTDADLVVTFDQNINTRNETNCPIIPSMITKLHTTSLNLRAALGIPGNCIVFGRYGNPNSFNMTGTQNTITNLLGPAP